MVRFVLQAKSDLELALKNRSDRNAAQRSTALKAALDRAEPLLADSTAGADAEGAPEILEAVAKMAAQARMQVEEDAREQVGELFSVLPLLSQMQNGNGFLSHQE